MMTLEVFSVILVINIITNFQPKLGHMRVENALVKSRKNVMSVKNQGISKEHLFVRKRRR